MKLTNARIRYIKIHTDIISMAKRKSERRSSASAARIIAPAHLGLIPDGNRRWSKSNRLALLSGYQNGVKKFVDFSIWAKGFGVKTLTVWALSTENIKRRSRIEIVTLYSLYIKAAKDPELLALLLKNNARIRVVGNLTMVPKKLREALSSLEAKTLQCKEFTINLLIGYGGRDDLLAAAKSAGAAAISEDNFKERMISSSLPDLDLIIRTSGEHRLSGFLPWQSSYSEIYFARKFWPDFQRSDLKRAICAFSARERRFGR